MSLLHIFRPDPVYCFNKCYLIRNMSLNTPRLSKSCYTILGSANVGQASSAIEMVRLCCRQFKTYEARDIQRLGLKEEIVKCW